MKDLFLYNKKSNDLIIHSMLEAGFAHKRVIEEISHILNTHYMWIAQLKGERYNKNLWQPISTDDLFKANNLVHQKTEEFLAQEMDQLFLIEKGDDQIKKPLKAILYEIILFSNQHRAKVEVLFKKFNIYSPSLSYLDVRQLDVLEEF